MTWDGKVDILLIGGGMISQELILPTLFQERRRGKVGRVAVSALTAKVTKQVRDLFQGEEMTLYPDPDRVDPDTPFPELFREAIGDLGQYGMVIVATPDHLHVPMVMASIEAGYDCICAKPLCLKVKEAHQIREAAEKKNIYVLTEYHKRHDRAVRAVKYKYSRGELGEMLHGHAWIEEPKYMPLDKFSLWCEKSSPFEYIGVHYADVYYYVTGLKPKRLIAFGQKKFLPKYGKDAYDAVQAAITWEDDSVFWIQTSWVCSPKNSAMTNQGLQLSGTLGEYWADHKYRNLHFLTEEHGFEQYNPNFMKPFNSWEAEGLVDWVGYGYESIQQGIDDVRRILRETEGLSESEKSEKRRALLEGWRNLRALPHQALVGVAIIEGVRLSVDNGSRFVSFDEDLYPRLE